MYPPSVPASIEGEVEEQEEVEDNAASYEHLRIEVVRFNAEEPEEPNKANQASLKIVKEYILAITALYPPGRTRQDNH